jgi:hypothetical protein
MDNELAMVIADIQADINATETDKGLNEEINFDSRANAIDFIDFHIIDRLESLLQHHGQCIELHNLKKRAEALKHHLEKIDADLFKKLREKLAAGSYPPQAFKVMIHQYTGYDASVTIPAHQLGYNNLDDFINGLLTDQVIPEASLTRKPEMVFYQQTPARIIFELAHHAQLTVDDVFYDIGSGLGLVAILMSLMSGAKARGIEYDPAYSTYAHKCARQLNLTNVHFITSDARQGEYTDGTVFFLYTPFEGAMLQEVLKLLKQEAQKRPIRIFTYGPCSQQVAAQNWLTCVNGGADNPYQLYEFTNAGGCF